MGPEVNWKGWLSVFPNQLRFSARAQILFFDWKTKYLPSEVHWPQHSVGGGFQPGSNSAASLPDTETCHNERRALFLSPAENRISEPSGDQATSSTSSGAEKSLVGAEPSLLAMTKSWPSP